MLCSLMSEREGDRERGAERERERERGRERGGLTIRVETRGLELPSLRLCPGPRILPKIGCQHV